MIVRWWEVLDETRCPEPPTLYYRALDGSVWVATADGTTRPEVLAHSDTGIEGAVPLPEQTWFPAPDEAVLDEAWAEQNRRINDLLMGRDA